MAVPELLDRLLRAHGPAGHEHLAFDVIRDAVGEGGEVESDPVGNLVVRRRDAGARWSPSSPTSTCSSRS